MQKGSIALIILYFLLIIYYYNTFITFFSWKKQQLPESYNTENKNKTFAILIACHNEEEVIRDNLEAIYLCDYPKEDYHVYVIADNCTDDTVSVTDEFIKSHEDMSCSIVKVSGGSKPKALSACLRILKFRGEWNKDNVLILDADNKISPNMLKAYNFYHEKSNILQCRILSENDDSLVSRGFASSFNTMAFGFQLAKNRIGLSASLSGTGFSVNRRVFDYIGFENCETLTEDLEFSILAILKGYKVRYVEEEYVINQNLEELVPSIIQRIRWCRGHIQVSKKTTVTIFKQFIKKPTLQLLDCFMFVNSPSRIVIYVLSSISSLVLKNHLGIPIWISVAVMSYNIFFIMYCNSFKVKHLISHLYYSAFMICIVIYSMLTSNKKEWAKTKHKKIIKDL